MKFSSFFFSFFPFFSVKLTALIVYRDSFKLNSSPALKSRCLSSAAGSAARRHTQSPQINFRSRFRHHLCPISAEPGRDCFPSMECSFPSLSCRLWRWGSWWVERIPAPCKRRALRCDSVLGWQDGFGAFPWSDGPKPGSRATQTRGKDNTSSSGCKKWERFHWDVRF